MGGYFVLYPLYISVGPAFKIMKTSDDKNRETKRKRKDIRSKDRFRFFSALSLYNSRSRPLFKKEYKK